jgi:protein involved in polysaccharide export with SLBB domain
MNCDLLRRWAVSLLLAYSSSNLLSAAENEPAPKTNAPPETTLALTGSAPGQRARWQERLTLGPGDILNLLLLDMPETALTEVPIAPDGRIAFLEARDIVAAGLTVDELRGKLDAALAKYYQNPRTVVIPVAYRSKKYFMLGTVMNKGVFTMDRPLRLIEAIARAGGWETGLYESRTVELTDLQRSFLIRKGERLPIDFERLFQQGDLSQNVSIEPDDYLYFGSAAANEIYVLGEVASPGVVAFSTRPTAISSITTRGGFTVHSFKKRVLIVRGSLDHPETFVVDTGAILAGKAPDFRLQPRDIVYVCRNPWKVAAEIVDVAAKAFVQSFIVTGTTAKMPAFIN